MVKKSSESKLIRTGLVSLLAISCFIFPALAFAAPTAQSTPPQISDNLLAMGLLAFIAGVLSFTSPCTLPILPAYFGFAIQAEQKKVTPLTVAFFLGLGTTFGLLGGSATLLGSLLRQYREVLITMGGVLIIILGVFTVFGKGLPWFHVQSQPRATLRGSYLFGATFAFGWTACIAPVLGSLLILASTVESVYQGMLFLFIYAMGLGLPLILLSSFLSRSDRESRIWRILRGKGMNIRIFSRDFYLHTTNLLSGSLLLGVGLLMVSGYLTIFNRYIPPGLQIWFSGIEEWFIKTLAG
ncbi:MAG: cytochrome c biogenesis protein CcdA [Chloroflexi bacterium]|nr:cytochrome c biogenesis protein CcdA [Chloroflexota bacterium]